MADREAESAKDLVKAGLILLHVAVIGLAVSAWGASFEWEFSASIYVFFPLLGLLAFSLMWLHYVTAAVNRQIGRSLDTKRYFEVTEKFVLGLILLHPGLFLYQLWRDGFGLPPGSYGNYVGQSGKLFVLFGVLALSIFLLYEFKNFLQKTKFWPYMVWLNNIGMILIFIHAWQLGGALSLTWFRIVWVIYFVVFLVCLVQKYRSPNPTQLSTS